MNDILNDKPIENGNSEIINEVCRPMYHFMPRYESISNFYSEEPAFIRLKINKDNKFDIFEQIMRVRVWSSGVDSWIIYSKEREWFNECEDAGDLIIRHVVWDRDFDRNQALKYTDQMEIASNWPKINISNYYLNRSVVFKLFNYDLKEIDNTVVGGISLKKRNSNTDEFHWNDIEFMRLFDWGQVKSTWCPLMENDELEKRLQNLCKKLEGIGTYISEEVYQMELDYTVPTELYKKIIHG